MKRDYQRSRVYSWDWNHVSKLDKSQLSFDQAKMMVTAIWMSEGLINPPDVLEMPKQERKAFAKANRNSVFFPTDKTIPTWIVLHELAHSLTNTVDGNGDRHGADFVGVYMKLLVKYLKMPLPLLMFTAQKEKVDFNIGAKYYILDK